MITKFLVLIEIIYSIFSDQAEAYEKIICLISDNISPKYIMHH